MNANRAQITTPAAMRDFVLGGRALFTLVGLSTRFTYQVQLAPEDERFAGRPPLWFVSVLTGPQNTTDYTYLGTLTRDGGFRHDPKWGTRSWRVGPEAPSSVAFAWLWRWLVAERDVTTQGAKFWHEGRCCRCGRTLTTPESVAAGIGPVCAGRPVAA